MTLDFVDYMNRNFELSNMIFSSCISGTSFITEHTLLTL
jgi:hypothetical protein